MTTARAASTSVNAGNVRPLAWTSCPAEEETTAVEGGLVKLNTKDELPPS